jgi:aminoglycoside phosphotransferase (APT) family kinase protein
MRWLPDPSSASVSSAVAAIAPGLSGLPVVVGDLVGREEPLWQAGTARVGEGYVAKFAWSQPAAARIAYEIAVLNALSAVVPYLPEIVARSTEPVLLITRRVPGASLFQVADAIDRDDAGRQLGRFLSALRSPYARHRVEAAVGRIPRAHEGPQRPVSTAIVRERIGRWIRPDQEPMVRQWCDRADDVLSPPMAEVLVHADLHGDNQIWQDGELRLVVDFETAGLAEPEYDLRGVPGTGPGRELLAATMRHYETATGRGLSGDRVMAWHVLTALTDVLWRSESGVPLAGGRTAGEWIDDLENRLS